MKSGGDNQPDSPSDSPSGPLGEEDREVLLALGGPFARTILALDTWCANQQAEHAALARRVGEGERLTADGLHGLYCGLHLLESGAADRQEAADAMRGLRALAAGELDRDDQADEEVEHVTTMHTERVGGVGDYRYRWTCTCGDGIGGWLNLGPAQDNADRHRRTAGPAPSDVPEEPQKHGGEDFIDGIRERLAEKCPDTPPPPDLFVPKKGERYLLPRGGITTALHDHGRLYCVDGNPVPCPGHPRPPADPFPKPLCPGPSTGEFVCVLPPGHDGPHRPATGPHAPAAAPMVEREGDRLTDDLVALMAQSPSSTDNARALAKEVQDHRSATPQADPQIEELLEAVDEVAMDVQGEFPGQPAAEYASRRLVRIILGFQEKPA